MAKDNLIDVIESLLEADMTKKDPVKNPQEEKDEDMEEATQNSVNAKSQKTDQEKMKTSPDTQGVLGKDGKAIDAGGDKDVGSSKGSNPSDASSDTQGVLGKDGKALDAGGDKDEGGSKGDNASDASSDTQGVLGKDGKALDAGGDKDVGKLKEAEETEEELTDKQKKLDKDHDGEIGSDDLKKVRAGEETDEEEMEEAAQEASNAKNQKTDQEEMETSADDQGVLGKDGTAIDGGGDKDVGKLKEADHDEEEMEEADASKVLGKEKGAALDAGGDKDVGKLKEADDEEEGMPKAMKAEDKGDMDGDGKDEPDEDEYMDAKDKAIKKAMKKEETEDDAEEMEEDLDEDFRSKAAVIFEAAVGEKVTLIREELQEEYDVKLNEEVKVMNEKISEYVDYAVQEWIKENALEIKYSLRTEIAENFIRGLKGLFEESYIDIPEEDVSVVDELTESVESYKDQLDETTNELETLKQEILEMRRTKIVEEVSEGLTQTQALRLERLAEGIEAVDVEEFRFKVEELKEGYFDPETNQAVIGSLTEEVFNNTAAVIEEDGSISQYAKFLSKTVLK